MIGETISHYKVLEKLGEGGMGAVYKCEDLVLHRTVALKFLSDPFVRGENVRSRFLNEARIAATKSILKWTDFVLTPGSPTFCRK